MFDMIKRRWQSVGTIKALCEGAEKHANAEGQQQPGAEHFLLAALELPDGTARDTFLQLGADPDGLRQAIQQQYADALNSVGIEAPALETQQAVKGGSGIYQAQPSGQALMQQLSQQAKSGSRLLGAHVLLAAATAQQGVAVRALRRMGIDLAKLADAARATISAAH